MKNQLVRKIVIASSALLLLGAGCIQVKSGGTAGGNDGGVFKSGDHGVVWQQKSAVATVGQPKSIGGLNVTEIAFDPSDSKAVYAGTPDQIGRASCRERV